MVRWRHEGFRWSCSKGNVGKTVRTMAQAGVCLGTLAIATQAQAQSSNSQFYQVDHEDVAAELLQRSVAATSLPTQQYMREVFWGFPETMPAFFRDSMVQV